MTQLPAGLEPETLMAGLEEDELLQGTTLENLIVETYESLRRMARKRLREGYRGQTIQTTVLVNEACLKLMQAEKLEIKNKRHFYYFAGRIMRHLIVNHIRDNHAAKRGGGNLPLTLEQLEVGGDEGLEPERLLGIHQALQALENLDPRQCRIVEMRYFAGLTHEEIAEALDISKRTVLREWKTAKLWLYRQLTSGTPKN